MLSLSTSHFLTGEELSQKELLELIDYADFLRLNRGQKEVPILQGKTMALIFEKPSLRTRVSFSVGVQELGGSVLELTNSQKKQEDPEDSIRVLQGMVHGVMLRTFEHEILERMLTYSKIPLINGLSDLHHPCQALADLQTLKQYFGSFKNLKLAYIGDGNNVLHSLLLLLPFVGVDLHYACPEGYQPQTDILKRARARATQTGAQIKKFKTPAEAVSGANAIYTDVWTSMGFEQENKLRLKKFKGYQINSDLYKKAAKNAIIMHCLPMNKGQEITVEMANHSRSALFAQAENRLHAQKALMTGLFNTSSLKMTTASRSKKIASTAAPKQVV